MPLTWWPSHKNVDLTYRTGNAPLRRCARGSQLTVEQCLDAGAHQVRMREVEPVDICSMTVVLDCESDLRSTSQPMRCFRDPNRETTAASKEVN